MDNISSDNYKGTALEKSFKTVEPMSFEKAEQIIKNNFERKLIDKDCFDKAMEELDIVKGKHAVIGEVRTRKGGKYKKTVNGWEKVTEEKEKQSKQDSNISLSKEDMKKPSTIEDFKNAVEGKSENVAILLYNRIKGNDVVKTIGRQPLKMTDYTGSDSKGLSNGVNAFNTWSSEDMVYKKTFESGKVFLIKKDKAKKLFDFVEKIIDKFHKLPSTAYPGGKSPYAVFGIDKPKISIDDKTVHISLDTPREIRHPNEYKHYYDENGNPKSAYTETFKRIEEIEIEIDKIAKEATDAGFKVEISKW